MASDKTFYIKGCEDAVTEELYLYYRRSNRRIRYYERDIKTETPQRDKQGNIVRVDPSKEDSLERLMEAGADFEDPGADVPGKVIRKMMIKKLRSCYPRLRPCERALIKARYFGGESQSIIAARCGVSQAAVSRQEAKILAKLKAMLENFF
jgi:RNA polymerase sigma factor (sigma-70 family)